MKRKLIVAAGVFFPLGFLLIGLYLAASYGMRTIPRFFEETARGPVPEGFDVLLPEEGDYTVWLIYQGQDGPNRYDGGDSLPPGGNVYLFDSDTRTEIPIQSAVHAMKHSGEESAVSLGRFETNRDDQVVEVRGAGLHQPVLIGIAPTNTAKILGTVLILVLMLIATLWLSVYTFLWLHRVRNSQSSGNAT